MGIHIITAWWFSWTTRIEDFICWTFNIWGWKDKHTQRTSI